MKKENKSLKTISIAIFGETCVGKTGICNSYLGVEFKENFLITLGIDKLKTKVILKDGSKMDLKIWDTAGVERCKSMSLKTLTYANGALLVFDVTNKSSFENLNSWLKAIHKFSENFPIILFGNKVDIEKDRWEATPEEAKNFAKEFNLPYFEVSAKTNKGIEEGFSYLANYINENIELKNNNNIKVANKLKNDEKKCVGKGKNNKRKSK